MKLFSVVLVCLLAFAGCQNNAKTDSVVAKANITYFQDERTGLCFAALSSWDSGGNKIVSITCVPTTNSVLEQIKRQRNDN